MTSAAPPEVVDPDEPASWPDTVRAQVDAWHESIASSEFQDDLEVPFSDWGRLLALLDGGILRTYHCTRLLPSEVALVESEGLRPFTVDFFDRRLEAALDSGEISRDLYDRLSGRHIGAVEAERAKGRWGLVWLSVGRAILGSRGAVGDLLGTWGGEGIYRSIAGQAALIELKGLGIPTVVVCDVRVIAAERPITSPDLGKVFLASHRRMPTTGNLGVRHPVSPAEICELWQPGHPKYEEFVVSL